ncbi:hypothetical protein JI735_32240 [Paenibacillus sonchi]|uniref:Uncharacterized protein n=1 Tax=Paenibacillus sonchi TaxID=373687 RepID=A0A974PD17_9BACL|nr:DUF6809 family protein [Paenibacillus sonchi]MCE3202318.1 hypothetical protein [Paenibacillus sonchi]QQZ61027.1 hypothetical protein JI735_32240 [Paenibacillus sonchi]
MASLLDQLYHGNLRPDEKAVPNDPQYRHISRKTSETLEAWRKRHSEEEFNELEVLLELYSQTHGMELASSFTYGFRLGAGLMVEVLIRKEELADKLSSFPD